LFLYDEVGVNVNVGTGVNVCIGVADGNGVCDGVGAGSAEQAVRRRVRKRRNNPGFI
jgi:hypothetical protein